MNEIQAMHIKATGDRRLEARQELVACLVPGIRALGGRHSSGTDGVTVMRDEVWQRECGDCRCLV